MDDEKNPLKVLVLGGNGMLGSDFVVELLGRVASEAAGEKEARELVLVLANRGHCYWDGAARLATARLAAGERARVEHVALDRKPRALSSGSQEEALTRIKELGPFHWAVDFSSTKAGSMQLLLNALGGRVGAWVYISSDSVYEVCEPFAPPLKEEMAVRPMGEEERRRLAQEDGYGEEKLACEEALRQAGIRHLCLRLPDVLGPRDGTLRLLRYCLWTLLQPFVFPQVLPLHIPAASADRPLSFVYSLDVARCITSLILFNSSSSSSSSSS
ncbi:MAG: hypothetical protein Q8P67_03945, partial [archaeon]|nr:hypothetical protein [archaeon]